MCNGHTPAGQCLVTMAIICSVVFLMMTVGGIGVVANPDEETDFEKLGGPCRIVEIRTRAQWSTGSGCHTGYTYRFCDPDEASCTHLSVLEQHLVCDGSCGACTSRTIVPSLENNTAVDCWRKKSNTNPPDNLCGSPRCYKVFTPPDPSNRTGAGVALIVMACIFCCCGGGCCACAGMLKKQAEERKRVAEQQARDLSPTATATQGTGCSLGPSTWSTPYATQPAAVPMQGVAVAYATPMVGQPVVAAQAMPMQPATMPVAVATAMPYKPA